MTKKRRMGSATHSNPTRESTLESRSGANSLLFCMVFESAKFGHGSIIPQYPPFAVYFLLRLGHATLGLVFFYDTQN